MTKLRIYFIDVGQGDCSLICLPDGTGVVVDCVSHPALTELMRDVGVDHLRAVIATHLDSDHIRGLNHLLNAYRRRNGRVSSDLGVGRIDSLWVAPDRSRAHLSEQGLNILSFAAGQARKEGISVKSPYRDDGDPPKPIWQSQDGEICVELLLPFWRQNVGSYLQAGRAGNPASSVVRVRHGRRSVVIGGDAVLGSFELLNESMGDELRADVVRSPHHAGNILADTKVWNSYEDLYSRAGATVAVHSLGTHNRHGHPAPAHVVASTNGGKCHVMCTQMTSQCHSDLKDSRLESHGFFEVAYPYHHRLVRRDREKPHLPSVPCAGTALVVLDEANVRVFPTPPAHEQFVNLLDRPLCRASPSATEQ